MIAWNDTEVYELILPSSAFKSYGWVPTDTRRAHSVISTTVGSPKISLVRTAWKKRRHRFRKDIIPSTATSRRSMIINWPDPVLTIIPEQASVGWMRTTNFVFTESLFKVNIKQKHFRFPQHYSTGGTTYKLVPKKNILIFNRDLVTRTISPTDTNITHWML